jgi:sec-independent protein translocase protein TatA
VQAGAYNRLEVFGVHWAWIVLLLVVVLIIFGPGRLPELGGAVGKAMREFRKATNEITTEVTNAARPEPPKPAETAATGSSTSEADSTKS